MIGLDTTYFLHLISCAVKGETPSVKDETVSWKWLFEMAQYQILTATIFPALQSMRQAGLCDMEDELWNGWQEEYHKALVKELTFDRARSEILVQFDAQSIRYLPLKGVYLKDEYPKAGMRMFSDNDILIDSDSAAAVQKIMNGLGYVGHVSPNSTQDVYQKLPTLNFEMHSVLFSPDTIYYTFFTDIFSRAHPATGAGYELSQEDFYLYFIAHFHKHYAGGGCGIRGLVDTYLYLEHHGDEMDWDYLNGELAKMKLGQFAHEMSKLSQKIFDATPQLSADEAEVLGYMMSCGAYGVYSNYMVKRYGKSEKKGAMYLIDRLLPSYDLACVRMPALKKYPLLFVPMYLPLLLQRFVVGFKRLPFVRDEIRYVLNQRK